MLERRDNPSGVITGVAFQDFNSNGVRNLSSTVANDGNGTTSTAIDRGVAAVTVTAFDKFGASQGTATTLSDGTYNLSAGGTGPYRVEFTTLPQGLGQGPQGTDSKTTTQFVPDGTSANISVGLTRVGDYSQTNPLIATAIYHYGNAQGTHAADPAIVTFPYSAGATPGSTDAQFTTPGAPYPFSIPTSQVGATYGLTFDAVNRDLYASAYFKRHAGYGPGGSGAIYRANVPTSTPVGTTPGAGSLVYANLNTIFGAPVAGANLHDTADYDRDNGNTGWQAVGTSGLGGMDVSDDGKFIFVMNLNDRQLYKVPTTGTLDSSTVTRASIPLGNPNSAVINSNFNSGDLRPFAVQYYRGKVYVGVVYTAQTLANNDPNNATARNQLLAAVYEVNPTTLTSRPRRVRRSAWPRRRCSPTSRSTRKGT